MLCENIATSNNNLFGLVCLNKWIKLRYTLSSTIEFKYMVTLINEIQTMLSFSRIFKFNVFEFKKPNVLDLKNYTVS